jgi:hypothetical protein
MRNGLIKKIVKRMGGAQYVAKQLDVTPAYIYMLMNGDRLPSKRVAAFLGLRVEKKVKVTAL